MPEASRGSRRRRWLPAFGALLALAALLGLALLHYSRPLQLGRLLAAQAQRLLGAELTIGAGARYDFLPRLHAVLPQVTLRTGPHAAPFLRARSIEIALPWQSLRGPPHAIERLLLVEPVIDLDALEAWLATREPGAGALPELHLALEIRGGSVRRGDHLVASDIDARFDGGRDLDRWLRELGEPVTAEKLLPPFEGKLQIERLDTSGLRLEGVELELETKQRSADGR